MPLRSSSQPKYKQFRCPPLSAARTAQITREANIACDELLRFSAGDAFGDSGASDNDDDTSNDLGSSSSSYAQQQLAVDELAWEFAEQVDAIRVEKVRVKASTTNQQKPLATSKAAATQPSAYYFRGITQIESSLEEIMELYAVDTTHPNVQLEAKLSPDMLHSVILYEIAPYTPTGRTVFIGIRWSAVRSPYVLVRNRDYCYLEIQRRFTLSDGRRGFARCLHSVKIKSCPDMEKSHGFVRGSMYRSGFVFIESRRDRRTLDVVQAVFTDLKGNVPQWVAASGLRHRLMNLEHLRQYVCMKRVANQTFVRRSQMMRPDKAKTCFVCVDDIRTFQRRYNCQKCGEVMCGRCKHSMNAEIPVVGKMKLTICQLCALAINRTDLPPLPLESTTSSGDNGANDHRPFSSTPLHSYNDRRNDSNSDYSRGGSYNAGRRARALSLDVFHTANFDVTMHHSQHLTSSRSHEI